MSILVPYDGSDIARAALSRGVELADALGRELLTVSVIPDRSRYASRKGWLAADEDFDPEMVAERLRRQVSAAAPDAAFEVVPIEGEPSGGYIARKIRDYARSQDVVLLVLGSETVGRVVTPLTSVGKGVAAEQTYELYLVRSPDFVAFHPLVARE